MRAKTANPHQVAIVAYPGLSMFEFSVAYEVFGRPADSSLPTGWYELMLCGEAATVHFDNGLPLQVPRRLASLRRADTVVLPPCEDPYAVPDATLAAIRRAHARGARILSLCTGAFVLARTGLLDGRRAVTHWNDCPSFAARFPDVTLDPSVLFVDDGDVLTSAGSAASIDLCLHVVRCDFGAEVAARLARLLVVPPQRDGGQAQYIDTPLPTVPTAEPLSETLEWMVEHIGDDITISDLARRTATSPRSFARHFVATTGATPYQWLLSQRVQHAQRLLETTDLPIEAVAARVGLSTATNLRKHFRRQVGTSPAAYRSRFRVTEAA